MLSLSFKKTQKKRKKREREREGDAICSFLSLAAELGESLHPIIHITSQTESPFNFKTFILFLSHHTVIFFLFSLHYHSLHSVCKILMVKNKEYEFQIEQLTLA